MHIGTIFLNRYNIVLTPEYSDDLSDSDISEYDSLDSDSVDSDSVDSDSDDSVDSDDSDSDDSVDSDSVVSDSESDDLDTIIKNDVLAKHTLLENPIRLNLENIHYFIEDDYDKLLIKIIRKVILLNLKLGFFTNTDNYIKYFQIDDFDSSKFINKFKKKTYISERLKRQFLDYYDFHIEEIKDTFNDIDKLYVSHKFNYYLDDFYHSNMWIPEILYSEFEISENYDDLFKKGIMYISYSDKLSIPKDCDDIEVYKKILNEYRSSINMNERSVSYYDFQIDKISKKLNNEELINEFYINGYYNT